LFDSEVFIIMKMKHLLMIGVIALVVIGCVLAAGCTSTSANNGTNPASGVIFVGPSGGNPDEVKEIVEEVQASYELDGAKYDTKIRDLNPSPASGTIEMIDDSGNIRVEDFKYGLGAFESLISKGVHYLNNSNTPIAIKGQIRDLFMEWGVKSDGSNAESCYNYCSKKRGIGSISEFQSKMDKLRDVLDRAIM